MAGASRGIGATTARTLAAAGAAVVVAARSEPLLEALALEIRRDGGTALPVRCDLGDASSVEALVQRTVAEFGKLDVAFNNAAEGHMPAPLAELSVDELDRALRVNVRGFFLAMKHEIAAMLSSGGGAVVNMSSTAGLSGVRGMSGYSATKHAIVGLSKSAALDYADRRIRVNVVAPGPILTDRIQALPEERRAPISRAVPMGRATLTIDGGRLAAGA